MKIPESVFAYLTDRRVTRAILAFRDENSHDLMAGLSWDELPNFYRAELAFRQLQCDWAIFGLEAWDEIWEKAVKGHGWDDLSPQTQNELIYDASLATDDIIDTESESIWYGRAFKKEKWTLYASLIADPALKFRLRILCRSSGRDKDVNFSSLPATDEWTDWTSEEKAEWQDKDVQFDELKGCAIEAMAIVENHISQKNTFGQAPPVTTTLGR